MIKSNGYHLADRVVVGEYAPLIVSSHVCSMYIQDAESDNDLLTLQSLRFGLARGRKIR
jgi:hypothetical protein